MNVHATADEPTTNRAENTNEADPRQYNQWLCWKRSGDRKYPFNPVTGADEWKDPDTWMTYRKARAIADTRPSVDGIGFVLTDNDPFVCVDHDDVIDPNTGAVRPWSVRVVVAMDSYTEFSPSGGGLHTWGVGTKPGDRTQREQAGDSKIEVFDSGHFVTVTGDHLAGTPTTVKGRQDAIDDVYGELVAGDDDGSSSTTNADTPVPAVSDSVDMDTVAAVQACLREFRTDDRTRKITVFMDDFRVGKIKEHGYIAKDGSADRSAAEHAFLTAVYGAICRYGDFSNPMDAACQYMTHVCRQNPKTADGQKRKWLTHGESYRIADTAASVAQDFDPVVFDRWRRKRGRWLKNGEPSLMTVQTVHTAIYTLAEDDGDPTPTDYPTAADVAEVARQHEVIQDQTPRKERYYRNTLSKLVNDHGQVAKACITEHQDYRYYPSYHPDPPDAQYVVVGDDRREPDPEHTPPLT